MEKKVFSLYVLSLFQEVRAIFSWKTISGNTSSHYDGIIRFTSSYAAASLCLLMNHSAFELYLAIQTYMLTKSGISSCN